MQSKCRLVHTSLLAALYSALSFSLTPCRSLCLVQGLPHMEPYIEVNPLLKEVKSGMNLGHVNGQAVGTLEAALASRTLYHLWKDKESAGKGRGWALGFILQNWP